MTEKDLSEIEAKLKITLPKEYRELMLARAEELKTYGCFTDDFSAFFLNPKEIISVNKLERPADSGTGYAFPKWWKTFFLVGTNGGGDYYCLRLDNKPGVWMIGSDCGDEDGNPESVAPSLKAFIDERIQQHQKNVRQEAEAAERRKEIQEEMEEEIQGIAEHAQGNLTEIEKEWLSAQVTTHMFEYLDNLGREASPRKKELFEIVCSRYSKNYSENWSVEEQEKTDFLRDILGNPFRPVRFETGWRSGSVVQLARTIYERRAFDRMPALADALTEAGCDAQRILKHCRRKGGHVRGCWVLDLILEMEPEPKEKEYTWDFTWEHPTIDAKELKRRIQAFGTDGAGYEPDDDRGALLFADWLEEKGDKAWANNIRIRCALDGKAPGEDYQVLFKKLLKSEVECNEMKSPELGGFWLKRQYGFQGQWWDDDRDGMERGLPSCVDAVEPGRGAPPVAKLTKALEALVRTTPVRGIDFEWHYPNEMEAIFNSSGARHLRRMSFSNRPKEGQTGPVIEALVKSPLVRSLERLGIDEGLKSDADALALASASFDRLRRLDLHAAVGISCSARAIVQLMKAPWFRQLHHLHTGFSEECCETGVLQLAGMPNLHTLGLWIPPDRQILALDRAGEFPALKRLFIHCANLSGKYREAFCKLKAPQLIELWLRNSKAKTVDIRAMVTSPLFEKLRLLTFDGTKLDEASLESLAASFCATKLRILRIDGDGDCTGSFRSLAATPLTRSGAFPELTTLKLEHPFAKKVKRDTADFLKKLATPKLRHLTLNDCDFDDQCAEALASSPTFANLTRLTIRQGYNATDLLTPKAAEKMFCSSNLKNLVELELHNFALGKTLEIFADESVLPKLASACFWGSEAPSQSIEQLKAKRPIVYVGS